MEELIKKIVKDAKLLKDKYTDQLNAPVNYACIFCQSNEEQDNFIKEAHKLGEIIQETSTGPLFRTSLDTVAGRLQLLKIRKPDSTRLERGDADFTVSNYPNFKKKYLNKSGFSIIQKEGFEMVELYKKGNNVRAYFSFPTLCKKLNLV